MLPVNQCRCCMVRLSTIERLPLSSLEPCIDPPTTLASLVTECTQIEFSQYEMDSYFMCCRCRSRLVDFLCWKSQLEDVTVQLRKLEAEPICAAEKFEMSKSEEKFLDEDRRNENEPDTHKKALEEILRTLTKSEANRRKRLGKKMHKVHSDGLYHCPECQVTCSHVGRLIRHIELEHKFSKCDKFVCGICSEEFPFYRALKLHCYNVHKEKPYSCFDCSKTFPSYDSIRAHIKRIHIGIKQYAKAKPVACEICDKVLFDKKQLQKHRQSFHMPQSKCKSFECQVCGKKLASMTTLKKHKAMHLEPQAKVSCPLCQKQLADKYKLNYHISAVHDNRKDWNCEICGKFFKGAVNLRLHQQTAHSDDRPFQCPNCDASFKTGQILDKHFKRIHNDLPQVQCDLCDKWLKNLLSLKEHKKLHENKVFECAKCDSKFPSKKSLITHNSQAHFIYQCVICIFRSKKSQLLEHVKNEHAAHLNEESPAKAFIERVPVIDRT